MVIHDLGEIYVYDETTEEETIAEGLSQPEMALSYEHSAYWEGSECHGADIFFILRRSPGDTYWLGFNNDTSKIAVWYEDPR